MKFLRCEINVQQLCLHEAQFSQSVVSDSLWHPALHHARLPYSLLSPRACSNSCPLSRWCHPTIPSSVVPSSLTFNLFQHQGLTKQSILHIRWPKYWNYSFSISSFNEYSGLISFRIDWLDLLAVQGDSQESSPTPQFKSINSLVLSFLYSPALTSVYDYWKNQSFD